MTLARSNGEQLGWLLDNLVSQVANVSQALVLSRDGLVVAKSRNIGREEGDRLSALAAGLHSLARGTGQQVGGGEVRQTIIEMDSAFLFVMAAGQGTCLLVGAISEIRPLVTEETLSDRGIGIDDTSGVDRKATTTVAMDFGRITVRADLTLYLFGTPGQERFWFMWDELAHGAIGAVVLADTRRLDHCFAAVDYFEDRATPFLVAVNCFDGVRSYDPDDVRIALDLDPGTPVVLCDARERDSVKKVLIALVRYAIDKNSTSPAYQGRPLPAG